MTTNNCTECDKPRISPYDRCDCRLEWQVEMGFKKHQKLLKTEKELRDTLKNLKEAMEVLDIMLGDDELGLTDYVAAFGHAQEIYKRLTKT